MKEAKKRGISTSHLTGHLNDIWDDLTEVWQRLRAIALQVRQSSRGPVNPVRRLKIVPQQGTPHTNQRGKTAHEYIKKSVDLLVNWKESGLGQRTYARTFLASEFEQRAISEAKDYLCKVPHPVRQDLLANDPEFHGMTKGDLLKWVQVKVALFQKMTDDQLFESLGIKVETDNSKAA